MGEEGVNQVIVFYSSVKNRKEKDLRERRRFQSIKAMAFTPQHAAIEPIRKARKCYTTILFLGHSPFVKMELLATLKFPLSIFPLNNSVDIPPGTTDACGVS